jgi:hypothetical protein
MSGLFRGLIRSISETDANTQTPQEKGISLARAVTLQQPPAPPSGPPSFGAIPSAGMDIEVEASKPPLQGQGFTANLALTIMSVDMLTEYVQLYSIIHEEFLDYILANPGSDIDKIINSYLKPPPKRKRGGMKGGLTDSDKNILDNIDYGPFDKIHDWLGDRNKYFATTPGRLVPLICESATNAAIQPASFGLDFTSTSWGDSATKAISKILHGVDNPRTAKSINERALKVAVILKETAKYNFYFGPGDLPSSLAKPEKDAIGSIVSPITNFNTDLLTSFPGGKKWIYDACIGTYVRRQLGLFSPQVNALPNIWDPSKQGAFLLENSHEYIISDTGSYELDQFGTINQGGVQYTILQFTQSEKDVYNDPDSGIYYKTLNNRIFQSADIKIELHLAVKSDSSARGYANDYAKAAVLVKGANGDITHAIIVDSGFSVAELSEILLYVDAGAGPLRRADPPRYTILKGITDHLMSILRTSGKTENDIKMALIHFFLMWKYSGDDGTIQFADKLGLIYLSGDNLAFTKSLVIQDENSVGSYLKIKSAGEDDDDAGEDDINIPNRPQFFVAKLVPDNADSYLGLIEGTRLDIISGLSLQQQGISLNGSQILLIDEAIQTLLSSGNFFNNNPQDMLLKIMSVDNFNNLNNSVSLPTTVPDLMKILLAMKNINVTVSFVKNYELITSTLQQMTLQMVQELPIRMPSRRGVNFSTAWSQVAKLIKGASLTTAIEQVDDTLEKQIDKMKKNIETINDTHLKLILKLNPDMIVFIEQHMLGYRKALFSARIQTWLGENTRPEDIAFAKSLIDRVYPSMNNSFGGFKGGGYEITSILDFISGFVFHTFDNFMRTAPAPPSIRLPPLPLGLPPPPPSEEEGRPSKRRGGRKITKKHKSNKRFKKTRKQNIK